MISVSRFARVAVRWGMTTKIACAVLLFIGCNTKGPVLTTDDAGPPARVDAGPSADAGPPPDAGAPPDAGPPPDAGELGAGCSGAAGYGSLLQSLPAGGGLPGLELYEGCDGAPIILHGVGRPEYPPGPQEDFRAGLQGLAMEPITLGPCCPSRGAASGTCVVWPMSAATRASLDAGRYHDVAIRMWLEGASRIPMSAESYPYCMPVRRP